MVFKLVRVGAEKTDKIELEVGTHLIGRGSCLDCNDKRVSRNHGHLIVTEDSLSIEALHQNPCFITRKGINEKKVLTKSSKETLHNGDRFGLLPGSYWYEVLLCSPQTDSQATDVSNTQQLNSESKESSHESSKTNDDCVNKPNNENDEQANEQRNGQNDESVQDRDASKVSSNADVGFEENSELLDLDINETVEDVGRAESPSLLDKEQQEAPMDQEEAPMDQDEAPMDQEEAPMDQPTAEPEASPNTTLELPDVEEPQATAASPALSPPAKRSHSPDSPEADGAKKIKTEPEDVKKEPEDVKKEPEDVKKEPDDVKKDPDDAKAGPSNDQAGASNSAADVGKAPPSPAKPPNRERCLYGANCYRRNPQHKAQFSHPTDADWGAGDRAACPYGAACRKRDPRHWQIHEHPPSTLPPPPVHRPSTQQTKKARPRRRSVDSDDSDSQSLSPSLIVQGKRPRKPVPKDSPGSEPEDPFASDGSTEWEPPSDLTESLDF